MFQVYKSGLFNVFISGLFLMAVIPPLSPILADFEGRLMPVTKDLAVEDFRHDAAGVYFKATFDKVRECEYLGLVWYRVLSDGRKERVVIRFPRAANDDSDRTRAEGVQRTGEWFLAMTPQEFETSYAEVRHRCHPLWSTVTVFYP